MLKLFEPQSKVQKDRQIIRETDMRMAKYSRRGLISNFLIYTLCLLVEQTFIQQYQTLAIVLTCGLLLATALRGYLLFRMDAIYPRAPNAWRNKYFIATLIGASWWGVILSSVTLVLDRLPASLRGSMEWFCLLAGLVVTGLVAWFSVRLAWQSYVYHDVSPAADVTPLWIPQMGMVLGSIGFAMAFVHAIVLRWQGGDFMAKSGDEAARAE